MKFTQSTQNWPVMSTIPKESNSPQTPFNLSDFSTEIFKPGYLNMFFQCGLNIETISHVVVVTDEKNPPFWMIQETSTYFVPPFWGTHPYYLTCARLNFSCFPFLFVIPPPFKTFYTVSPLHPQQSIHQPEPIHQPPLNHNINRNQQQPTATI